MVKPVVCAHLRAGGMIAGELRQGIRRRGYDALDDLRNAILEAATGTPRA